MSLRLWDGWWWRKKHAGHVGILSGRRGFEGYALFAVDPGGVDVFEDDDALLRKCEEESMEAAVGHGA
jgi:hypothetical protein